MKSNVALLNKTRKIIQGSENQAKNEDIEFSNDNSMKQGDMDDNEASALFDELRQLHQNIS